VLVVGGGPVGMVTALGLARAGVSVRLIEARPSVANKNLIFHANGDDARLAEALVQLRKLGDDDESALSRLMFTKSLETPLTASGS